MAIVLENESMGGSGQITEDHPIFDAAFYMSIALQEVKGEPLYIRAYKDVAAMVIAESFELSGKEKAEIKDFSENIGISFQTLRDLQTLNARQRNLLQTDRRDFQLGFSDLPLDQRIGLLFNAQKRLAEPLVEQFGYYGAYKEGLNDAMTKWKELSG